MDIMPCNSVLLDTVRLLDGVPKSQFMTAIGLAIAITKDGDKGWSSKDCQGVILSVFELHAKAGRFDWFQ